MTRDETLEWIELILGSFDKFEMMAIINESAGQFDGDFFTTIGTEIERYQQTGNNALAERLEGIARAIASVRQNRNENL